jgi:hypothetical protein
MVSNQHEAVDHADVMVGTVKKSMRQSFHDDYAETSTIAWTVLDLFGARRIQQEIVLR